MENIETSFHEPVTAIIVRKIKPEYVSEFEDWVTGMRQVVTRFEGYQGTDIIRPNDQKKLEYVIIARFDSYDHMRKFLDSKERDEYIKLSEYMDSAEISIVEQHGFESWFSLPENIALYSSPPKYKMAILTLMVLYPSLLTLNTLVSSMLQGFPRPLVILVNLLFIVPLMTYFLMPWTTRIFRFWLYPQKN